MWNVVSGLINTFVLIRDFFVYLIPGAVLSGAIIVSGWPQTLVTRYHAELAFLPKPEWLKLLAALAACYIVGHMLVALGYFAISLFCRDPAPQAAALYRRFLYPSLYIEVDRRSIMADFRFGLGIAFVLSALVMVWASPWPIAAALLVAGVFMLWVAHTATRHVKQLGEATYDAAGQAITDKIPPERAPKPKKDEGE